MYRFGNCSSGKGQYFSQEESRATNQSRSDEVFPVNSFVLVEYVGNAIRRGPANKFLPIKKGPLQVIRQTGNMYTLLDLVTGTQKEYHVSRLSKFRMNPNAKQTPQEIAAADAQEWTVEEIRAHEGDPN